ncbi:hypothetical protein C0Q70_09542 [Pomacea canaliculata]|uniref:Uncharacterized protein n=1 Tax=Pomacea canaliculata TaxID=400727 RepID=A0A2T7PA38_POMCA|nr:hypothetical protein C0Q70_09542 [Pomacea canaliculata]
MVVGSPPRLAHPTPATSAAWLLRVASTSFLVCPVTFELSLSLPSSLLYNVCARLAGSSHRKQVLLLLLPYPDHKNATGSQHSSIRVDRVKSNGLLRVDRSDATLVDPTTGFNGNIFGQLEVRSVLGHLLVSRAAPANPLWQHRSVRSSPAVAR